MSSIDVAFIAPFVQAVQETFETMAGTTVRRRDAYFKEGYVMFGEISSVIGLSGAMAGTCAISMPMAFTALVVGRMLDEVLDPKENQGEVRDGIGELINMIAGRAKSLLSKTEYKFDITLPTIISGRGHEVFQRRGTRSLVLVFQEAGGEKFTLEICVDEKKKRKS